MSGSSDDTSNQGGNEFGYTGTRAEALEDGQLVDVSSTAAEAGFVWQVATTKAVWDDVVAWSDEDSLNQLFQSERMRLLDLLRYGAYTIRIEDQNASRVTFDFARIPKDGKAKRASLVQLEVAAHYDEDDMPVLTFMFPVVEEDS